MSNRVLVIASGNAGKIREFSNLLQQMPLQVDPQPEGIEVEETGITFRDNALLKARAVAEATGHWALADDSGLSVDALGGAPGVYSARYADSDPARIQRLLRELGDRNDRQARFSAALCIAAPDGSVLAAVEGHCEGSITFRARGTQGFGYDPVFEVKNSGLTFAEMTLDHKKQHGHRGRAFALLKPELEKLLANAPKPRREHKAKPLTEQPCTVPLATDEVYGHRHDHGLQRANRGRTPLHRCRLGLGPDLC